MPRHTKPQTIVVTTRIDERRLAVTYINEPGAVDPIITSVFLFGPPFTVPPLDVPPVGQTVTRIVRP